MKKLRRHHRARKLPSHLDHSLVRLGPVQRLDHAADGAQRGRGDRRFGTDQSDRSRPGLVHFEVQVKTLAQIEKWIGGNQPNETTGFTGLKAPKWPVSPGPNRSRTRRQGRRTL